MIDAVAKTDGASQVHAGLGLDVNRLLRLNEQASP